MNTVITLVIDECFVDISHTPFPCPWHEAIRDLIPLYLYSLTGKDEYGFNEAIDVGSSWSVFANCVRTTSNWRALHTLVHENGWQI